MSRGLAWILAGLLVTGFAAWRLLQPSDSAPLPVLYTLGGDITLDSTLGRPLSLSEYQGQPVLLNFGYTGCPDVCPTALARLRDVLALLGDQRDRVQPVFVTLNPEIDSPELLAPYLDYFDPALVGLSGSSADIAVAAERYRVFYERATDGSGAISHSSHIYLLDGAGRVRATFGEGIRVEDMAGTVRRLLQEPTVIALRGAEYGNSNSSGIREAGVQDG